MPRTRRVDVFVPAPPEAVEQSLRAQTRRALLPGLTDVWGDGRRPLKGRVENATFTLAPNERVFFARIHSTARGELTASGEGTRVTARVGISRERSFDPGATTKTPGPRRKSRRSERVPRVRRIRSVPTKKKKKRMTRTRV